MDKISTAMTNYKAEIGHPCWIPLCVDSGSDIVSDYYLGIYIYIDLFYKFFSKIENSKYFDHKIPFQMVKQFFKI